MGRLIDNLRRFNSKERFFLIGYALDNSDFNLGDEFRNEIKNKLGLELEIPRDAFSAMDYHIDWIYASLISFATKKDKYSNNKNIKANQEDVDFLVAFEDEQDHNTTHLIFIECKGFEPWNRDQLQSKLSRLKKIFIDKDISKLMGRVRPHLILMSPNSPTNPSKFDEIEKHCASWMLENGHFKCISLPIPEIEKKKTVQRCDEDKKRTCNGGFFKIIKKPMKN